MKTKQELIAVEYVFKDEFDNLNIGTSFHRMNSPFYHGEKWAVRSCGSCLGKKGKWIREPMPSQRDKRFYRNYRFDSLDDAIAVFNQDAK